MAVFAFSQPQPVFTASARKPLLLRRMFDAVIEARMAQARREVANYVATVDPKTRAKFDLDAAVVGKNGMYAWPY